MSSILGFVWGSKIQTPQDSVRITILYPNQKTTTFREETSKLLITLSPVIREMIQSKQYQITFKEELRIYVPLRLWDTLITAFERYISFIEFDDKENALGPNEKILTAHPKEYLGLIVILDFFQMRDHVESCSKLFCSILDSENKGPEDIRKKFDINQTFFEENVFDQVKREINAGAWNKEKRKLFLYGLVNQNLDLSKITVSYFVDHNDIKQNIQNLEDGFSISDHLFSHLPSRSYEPKEIDNINATKCNICSFSYGYYHNKSTCRICGSSICDKCRCNLHIPHNLKLYQPLNGYLGYLQSLYRKGVPVCNNCSQILIISKAFEIIGLVIQQLEKAATVDLSWRAAAIGCLGTLRIIQYHLPTKELSEQDKRLLWRNRNLWKTHDKWLVQFIKAVDWDDKEQSEEAKKIIDDNVPTAICFEAMCTRNCTKSNKLEPYRALELLNDSISHEVPRKHAIDCLRNSNPSEIRCYLPVLIHNMRFESCNNSPIFDFLLEIGKLDLEFRVELFWGLSLAAEDKDYKYFYEHYKHVLSCKLGEDYKEIERGHEFMNIIKIAATQPEILNKYSLEGIILPVSPNLRLIKIHTEKIRVLSSKTRPTVFPCTCLDTKTNTEVEFSFMLKPEDLRKDQIAINLIRRAHQILKESGVDLPTVTYNVLPTSSQCGILEFVKNTIPIKEIIKKGDFSTYFEYADEEEKKKVYERFKNSVAFASVITFLLSVGDRHLENILVAKTGEFFHIDFGFMAGEEAYNILKNLKTPVRIPPEIQIYLNKEEVNGFDSFASICAKIYVILKKHYALFLNLLRLLHDATPKIEYRFNLEQLENVIMEQFRPQDSDMLSQKDMESAVFHGEFMIDRLTEVVRDVK